MAFVGEVPWHNLGIQVDEDIDLDEFRRSAGLDWEVQKSPVLFSGGTDVDDSVFKGKFVLTVTSKNSPLGNRYYAERVDVEVVAADELSSAVSGAIYSGDNVITTASSKIEPGSQVRMKDK
ncbi:MAG TPA: hypothetical protein PLY43_00375 [Ruminococcus sp.]|nr:hypothetical protein [Ruminococcus sp.]